jgi:protein TonB
MGSIALRSGNPGGRLGAALAASLALHLALLFPPLWRKPPAKPAPPPLMATLAMPEAAKALATRPEAELSRPAPEPAELPVPVLKPPADKAGAVSQVPTFRPQPPRELKGKALDAALAALSREAFYPREAIERGIEGRVVLLLTLDGAGRVTGVEVAGSSGHALLDAAALKAAARIGALPGGGRQALLPVEFRLE